MAERIPQQKQQTRDDDTERTQDRHRLPDGTPYTPVPPCAKILPDDGGGRKTERVHHHPVDQIHLAVHCPARHGIRAEPIDRCLDEHIGKRIHERLHCSRNTDPQNAEQKFRINPMRLPVEMNRAILPQQTDQHTDRAHILRHNGGDGDAGHAPVHDDDHHKIQNHIGHRARGQIQERPPRIPRAAQNRGAHVVYHIADHPERINAQIRDRELQRVSWRVHRLEHRPRRAADRRRQNKSSCDRQYNAGVNSLLHLAELPGAVKLRDHNRLSGRDSDKQPHENIDQRRRRSADRGQRLLADKTPDHNRVHRVVQQLKERSAQQRQEEQQKLLPDHAGQNFIVCPVFLPLHPGHSSAPPRTFLPLSGPPALPSLPGPST